MSVSALRFKDDGQEFPEWEEKILEELADVSTGNKDTQNKIDDGLYPFYVRSQTVERINSFAYDGEAILTSGDGVGVGKNFHYINGKFDYHQRVYCIFNFKNQVSGLYIFYYFSEKFYKRVMGLSAKNSVDSIRRSMITEMLISIPSLPEQTKIANFLTAVDDKITLLTKKADLLSQYKKGVMQQIFSQELRFKDDDGQEFPEWEEKTLGEFLIPEFREIKKPTDPYLAIGIRSHCKGTFQKPDAEPEKNAMDSLFQVKENDLIVNITFAWEGAIAIVKKEDDGGFVSHRFPTYIFNEKISTHKFFQYVFINPRFREQLDLISPGGAGRNRVMSKKEFLKIKCDLPHIKEQTKIANFLTAIDEKITNNQTQLDAVKQYKQGLLQQMFV